ncbi:hypothetical protein [Methylobacterium crusticola]|uniref:hypothetical protein n=1 Tax=Methylobacterium crusticola TaxID=1697972 RepID=UPI000FFB8C0B|nr:hypothetical protein [Methylobacterium crusticola]
MLTHLIQDELEGLAAHPVTQEAVAVTQSEIVAADPQIRDDGDAMLARHLGLEQHPITLRSAAAPGF